MFGGARKGKGLGLSYIFGLLPVESYQCIHGGTWSLARERNPMSWLVVSNKETKAR